ncbi:MAG: hypothetical protein V1789_09905 [PVC group bacterium]
MKNTRPILTVLLVIFSFYAAVILVYAARFDFNLSGFACIGDRFASPEMISPGTVVILGSRGYDGQFFFFAAQDPLIRNEAWRSIDVPAYRYQRILYPWLAGLLALGEPDWIPLTLVLVNLAAILMGSFFVARMLEREGKSPWYACVYGLFSGFILCVLRDLAGPVAMGFLVGALDYFSRRKFYPGAVFFSAALLSREVLIVVPAVYLLFALFSRGRRGGGRLPALAGSFVPFLLWSGYVFFRFRDRPWRGGSGNVGPPLSGLISYGKAVLAAPGRSSEKAYLVLISAVCVLSLYLAVREVLRSKDEEGVSFLIYALFPFFLSNSVWVEPWSYGRVLRPGAVLLIVNFSRSRDRLYLYPLFGHLLLSGVILWWVGVV